MTSITIIPPNGNTRQDGGLLAVARAYYDAGLVPIPVAGGEPLRKYRQYHARFPAWADIARLPWREADGLAVVLGHAAPSGGHWWCFDVEKPFRAEAEDWLDQHVPGWRTGVVAESQRGGIHVYALAPRPIWTRYIKWGEIRGRGVIVFTPPSPPHKPDGVQPYRWLSAPAWERFAQEAPAMAIRWDPDELPPPPGSARSARRGGGAVATPTVGNGHQPSGRFDVARALAGVPLGERNSALFKLACRLRQANVPRDVAEGIVAVVAANCSPPWGSLPEDRETPEALVRRVYARYEPGVGPATRSRHEADCERSSATGNGSIDPLNGERPGGAATAVAAGEEPPSFPLDALPEPARGYVAACARALDCPVEFVAVPFLAEAAAAMGNRFVLALTSSWHQPPILWVCTVGEPGTAKSPAAELAGRPLDRLQQEALAAWRAALTQHEAELAAWQASRGAGKGAERGVVQAGPRPERPEAEHFYTTDATIEGLMRILAHPQSRTPGLVVRRDELVGWVKAFDAYKAGRGGERQTWLSLWTGRPVKVDRAGRDPYFCARPCVSVSGGVQPDMLPQLEAEAGCRDGFLERVLWSWPESRPLRLTDVVVPDALLQAVAAVLRRLRGVRERRGTPAASWGNHPGPSANRDGRDGRAEDDDLLPGVRRFEVARASGPAVVRLSADARAVFAAWHEENCQAQERVTGLIQGYYAKLPSQAARLCLVLHALAHPEDPAAEAVSAATMQGALALAEYFRAHAHKVFARFGIAARVQDSVALRLLRVLGRLGGSATGRALDDAGLRAGPERERAAQALAAAGLLRIDTEPHDGPGRPAVRYTLTAGDLSNLSNLSQGVRAAVDGGVGMGTDGPPRRPGAVGDLSNLSQGGRAADGGGEAEAAGGGAGTPPVVAGVGGTAGADGSAAAADPQRGSPQTSAPRQTSQTSQTSPHRQIGQIGQISPPAAGADTAGADAGGDAPAEGADGRDAAPSAVPWWLRSRPPDEAARWVAHNEALRALGRAWVGQGEGLDGVVGGAIPPSPPPISDAPPPSRMDRADARWGGRRRRRRR